MPAQFTFLECEKVSQMIHSKATSQEVALALGRPKSTVSRELKRNSISGVYFAVNAQAAAQRRRSQRPIERKMDRPSINQEVRSGNTKFWSPEQVAAHEASRDRFHGSRLR